MYFECTVFFAPRVNSPMHNTSTKKRAQSTHPPQATPIRKWVFRSEVNSPPEVTEPILAPSMYLCSFTYFQRSLSFHFFTCVSPSLSLSLLLLFSLYFHFTFTFIFTLMLIHFIFIFSFYFHSLRSPFHSHFTFTFTFLLTFF